MKYSDHNMQYAILIEGSKNYTRHSKI